MTSETVYNENEYSLITKPGKRKTFSQSPGESPQLLGHLHQQKDVFGKKLEGDFERMAKQKV